MERIAMEYLQLSLSLPVCQSRSPRFTIVVPSDAQPFPKISGSQIRSQIHSVLDTCQAERLLTMACIDALRYETLPSPRLPRPASHKLNLTASENHVPLYFRQSPDDLLHFRIADINQLARNPVTCFGRLASSAKLTILSLDHNFQNQIFQVKTCAQLRRESGEYFGKVVQPELASCYCSPRHHVCCSSSLRYRLCYTFGYSNVNPQMQSLNTNGYWSRLKQSHVVEACEGAVSLADKIRVAVFDAIQGICSQHAIDAQERVQAMRMSACTAWERTQR